METSSSTLSTVEGYLRLVASFNPNATPGIGGYHSLAEFVLKNGRRWAPQALPKGFRGGRERQCYMNAANLAMDHRELTYCEGYASAFFPVPHAWCVDKEGKVIDTTWRLALPECQYFGIAIKYSYLRRALLRNGTYGLIDNMETGFEILLADPKGWRHKLNDLREPDNNQPKKGQTNGKNR